MGGGLGVAESGGGVERRLRWMLEMGGLIWQVGA